MKLKIFNRNAPVKLDSTAIRARRAVWVGSALSAIGATFFALSTHRSFGNVPLVTYAWLQVAFSMTVFAWAFLQHEIRQRHAIGLVLAIILPHYYLIWANHVLLAESQLLWAPFLGLKVVVLALAVINPGPTWLCLGLLGGFSLESIVLWFHLNLGALPAVVTAGEPWFTAIFMVVSAGLIVFRWQHEILERQLLAAELHTKLLSRVAHYFLQIRDQANTPLQHLTLAVELLDKGASTPQEQSPGMRRALTRLKELSQPLTQLDELVRWDGGELNADQNLIDQLREVERKFVKDTTSE